MVRSISAIFQGDDAGQLGLYGAFGYDLAFQFEKIQLAKERDESQPDMTLFLPDEIFVLDNIKKDAWKIKYEFNDHQLSSNSDRRSTGGLPRTRKASTSSRVSSTIDKDDKKTKRESPPGQYADWVTRAKEEFRVGNLFEVVLSQSFRHPLPEQSTPATIFRRLSIRNPSPYGFFMNLGRGEYLVGASPEMFVRVESTSRGLRVETCPISGTIERGTDPLEDALQIQKLLASSKEESELTMCTDVDRNDKSRICVPGSVKVLGRRQIEIYSRLIHTVDHVEGYLRKGFDALDAFLCHTWAVTVTGAPKTWAMRFIEQLEPSPRLWYGGAVGMVGFDGSLNTGLTLRTIRIKESVAEVRAGATLLHDSDPIAEEKETELKASALIDAILRSDDDAILTPSLASATQDDHEGERKKVLLIDCEDSFVHTLANYLRQCNAEVVTCRSGPALVTFLKDQVDTQSFQPDLVVLSPGPGSPTDFQLSMTIEEMIKRKIPLFGVCLGLQGMVEYFGGKLAVLPSPMHGKPSTIARLYHDEDNGVNNRDVLRGLPKQFQVARYHSLYGEKATFPNDQLLPTAETEDGVIMAIQHRSLPIAAVQFHPESILTLPKHGMQIIRNALALLTTAGYHEGK